MEEVVAMKRQELERIKQAAREAAEGSAIVKGLPCK